MLHVKTNLGTKQSENLEHHAKTKSENNGNNGIKRNPDQRNQKGIINQMNLIDV